MNSRRIAKPLPDLSELNERFLYDPDTGLLVYRKNVKAEKQGEQAGLMSRKGYLRVGVNRKVYMAHRIAWKMHYGRDPVGVVDHANGQTLDNRICNLREATLSQNCANSKAISGKQVPFKGVSKNGAGFMARIRRQGKPLYIGTFKTAEEAHSAYVAAATEQFGEFAHDGVFQVMEAKRKVRMKSEAFQEAHENNDGV